MDQLKLLVDLHIKGQRQGPGGRDATRRAIDLAGLNKKQRLKIADIGCGTGAASLILAQSLNAEICAVDFLQDFLDELDTQAVKLGLADRIKTLLASMEALPFQDASLEVIWSEGAIYNIGFENGVRYWRKFLKPGGILAVSELTWLTRNRPDALTRHWGREYPEVGLPSQKIGQLETHGYEVLGYFPLSPDCWRDNYYGPMQGRFANFLDKHGHSSEAMALVSAEQTEIDLYEKYSSFVSYGFYVARKLPD
ncbi:class I SAM-dependent methyltransferase [Ruegeria arenilitoris]|uniref:class I SAM-dependent methyltransferase n=1 Tax=Ruegeria arenilitoris TaxID=1173585 RepID=UPI001481996E|nr:class I SAM-dependent methyltransferase [Ruegeria arenilitoris]